MTRESWRAVAIALAERLAHAGGCASHRTIEEGAAEMCPFCADAAAYRRFTRRLAQDGQKIRDPLEDARTVLLHEIRIEKEADRD